MKYPLKTITVGVLPAQRCSNKAFNSSAIEPFGKICFFQTDCFYESNIFKCQNWSKVVFCRVL